jgi:hypothetical protein
MNRKLTVGEDHETNFVKEIILGSSEEKGALRD